MARVERTKVLSLLDYFNKLRASTNPTIRLTLAQFGAFKISPWQSVVTIATQHLSAIRTVPVLALTLQLSIAEF